MVRYWVIPPTGFGNKEEFERVWEYACDNGIISIGFGWNMGDAASLSLEEMESRYLSDRGKPVSRHTLRQVFKFWNDIRPGDRVVARGGRKRIVGVGTVQGAPFYDPTRMQETGLTDHRCFLPVQWDSGDSATEKEFPSIVFGMQTVCELEKTRFEELTDRSRDDGDANDGLSELIHQETGILPAEQDPQVQTEFVLEKYLEEFIVSNFRSIFGDDIRVYEDVEGSYGRQYPTDIGVIDILAWEPANTSYVVVELKKGKTSDVVVGQTLRYMGWVKEHLCRQGESVRGVIVCRDHDERLDYALSMVADVEVRFYRVDFQLSTRPYQIVEE